MLPRPNQAGHLIYVQTNLIYVKTRIGAPFLPLFGGVPSVAVVGALGLRSGVVALPFSRSLPVYLITFLCSKE